MVKRTCLDLMFWHLVVLIASLAINTALGQEHRQSRLSQGVYLEAASASVQQAGDRVKIFAEDLSDSVQPAVVVTTDVPDPLVRAYAAERPFPPRRLEQLDAGRWVLTGPAGSHWTIEILAQTDAGWWTEYLEAVIGADTTPDPPPVEPPPQPPSEDHSRLYELGKTAPVAKADRSTAVSFAAALDGAAVEIRSRAIDIESARRIVGEARRVTMNNRETFEHDWNPFLIDVSQYFMELDTPATSVYANALEALAKGLRDAEN